MLDAISSGLDAASKALGGPLPGAPGGPAPMTFFKGENLGMPEQQQAGAQAPGERRPIDGGAPIEFIHFGYAHKDTSKNFSHGDLKDDAVVEFSGASKSHALLFRAALEREALLLSCFMTATQAVLKDQEDSKGGVGELMSMGADLLGSSGGSTGPKAADVNAFGEAVKAAVNPVNTAAVTYRDVHKGGIDLHQARSNYRAFLEKLMTPPPDPPGGGMLSQLPMMPGIPSAVKDVLTFIQGMAFKPFEVYTGLYVRLAKEMEPAIEKAVRSYSVQAITGQNSPAFYLWYPRPKLPESSGGGGGTPTGIGFLDDAKKQFDDIRKDVERMSDEAQDFLSPSEPPEPPPGGAYLNQALRIDTPPPPPGTLPPPPKELTDLIVNGFKAALGLGSLPGIAEKLIHEVTLMNNEFLRAVYLKLMERPAVQPISDEAMYRAARTVLLDKLVALVMENISALQRAKEFSFAVQGKKLSPGAALLESGTDALNDEVMRHMNIALELTMGETVDKLEGLRQQAVKANAVAMEAYLGFFPWMLALNFRNTFFPVWDLLIQNTFGKMGGPVGDLVHSASDAMKEAKSKIDEGRETASRLKKIKDRATSQGLQAGTGGENLTEYKKDWESKLPQEAEVAKPAVVAFFPFASRLANASAAPIRKSEWEAVKPTHKYESASAPAS